MKGFAESGVKVHASVLCNAPSKTRRHQLCFGSFAVYGRTLQCSQNDDRDYQGQAE